MNILAIDTSTMVSTVTIASQGEIIGDFNVNQEKTHSESLVPMIETLLDLLGMEIGDIDAFAICQGPGSFTGLRIGMTVAKTLAQVGKKKIIPISSLKAMAAQSSSSRLRVPMIDARGNRVYGAVFDDDLKEVIPEDLYTIDSFSQKVNELGREVDLIGLMNDKYGDYFKNARKLSPAFNTMIGKSMVSLAMGELDKDYNIYDLSPNYLRKSQAERELKNDKKS